MFSSKLRAIIVVSQLPSDYTGDMDLPELVGKFPRVLLRLSKMCANNKFHGVDAESYQTLKNALYNSLNSLLYKEQITAAGLACTSMSISLKDETNHIMKRALNNNTKITNMAISIVEALHKMKHMTRILIITPYIEKLHENVVNYFQSKQIDIVDELYFNLHQDEDIERLSPEYIMKMTLDKLNNSKNKNINGILLCCSAMRVLKDNFIDILEQKSNLSVITSSQAFIWNLLRISKIHDNIDGYGELFKKY